MTIIAIITILTLFRLRAAQGGLCCAALAGLRTVGFHNFNLRIFNLRVSNPNKLIVDVFFDTMSDFSVPGSRPKKTR